MYLIKIKNINNIIIYFNEANRVVNRFGFIDMELFLLYRKNTILNIFVLKLS